MRLRSCRFPSRRSPACRCRCVRFTPSSSSSRGLHEQAIRAGARGVGAERFRADAVRLRAVGGRADRRRGHSYSLSCHAGCICRCESAQCSSGPAVWTSRCRRGGSGIASRERSGNHRHGLVPARIDSDGYCKGLRKPDGVSDHLAAARRKGRGDLAGARIDRAIPEQDPVRRLDTQNGQVLVMSALVMAFLFLPLSVFVIDTALVDSSYAQLGETLQASAEDGASTIDEAAYRSTNGQVVRLDPVEAKTVADRSIAAAAVPGLQSWTVTVSGSRVTVTGTVSVQLMVLGSATLSESRSAIFAYGQ